MTALMAMHLRHSEAATSGLRRLLFQRLNDSLRLLQVRPLGDDGIHALRRALKQCRALLLLLRPALGKANWRREDAELEAAARGFGALRDRRVMHDTIDALAARIVDPPFEAFAGALRQEATASQSELPERLARNARLHLARVRRRLRAARLVRRNWSVLGPALRRSYRLARRARAESCRSGSDEALHRWRRWSKYLWHQLELIEKADASILALGARLHTLSDLLGQCHDLVVLRDGVKSSACFAADAEGGERFLALLDKVLLELRGEAQGVGDALFATRSRVFEKRLRALWRGWRRTP